MFLKTWNLNEKKITVSKISPSEVTNMHIMNIIYWFIQNICCTPRNKVVFDKLISDR